MQAFAYDADGARPVELPPAAPFGITDCYIKPNPCCRHIQPAVEALIGILNDEKIASDDVKQVAVETYRIAAEHAGTGWDDYRERAAELQIPDVARAEIPQHQGRLFRRCGAQRSGLGGAGRQSSRSRAPTEIDRLYPKLRPARVTVTTAARQIHAAGRRGARLAARAARRRRAEGEIPRPGRARARRRQGAGAGAAAVVDRPDAGRHAAGRRAGEAGRCSRVAVPARASKTEPGNRCNQRDHGKTHLPRSSHAARDGAGR